MSSPQHVVVSSTSCRECGLVLMNWWIVAWWLDAVQSCYFYNWVDLWLLHREYFGHTFQRVRCHRCKCITISIRCIWEFGICWAFWLFYSASVPMVSCKGGSKRTLWTHDANMRCTSLKSLDTWWMKVDDKCGRTLRCWWIMDCKA